MLIQVIVLFFMKTGVEIGITVNVREDNSPDKNFGIGIHVRVFAVALNWKNVIYYSLSNAIFEGECNDLEPVWGKKRCLRYIIALFYNILVPTSQSVYFSPLTGHFIKRIVACTQELRVENPPKFGLLLEMSTNKTLLSSISLHQYQIKTYSNLESSVLSC